MPTLVGVAVQNTNDPNVRAYHTRFEMSPTPECGARGSAQELGEFGALFLEIVGVAQVQVSPYILLVTKAPLYAWDEIDPGVVAILKMAEISQRQLMEAVEGATPAVD